MFFKLLMTFGFFINIVFGNTECEPCKCCKNSTCPNSWSKDCIAGCLDGYTGITCRNKCSDNCESCNQHSADNCLQCKSGYYNGWRSYQWIGNCSLTCPNKCLSCTTDSYCSSCKDGFYNGLNNNISYSDCRLSCYTGCKSCTSYGDCGECVDGYYGPSCQYLCSNGCIGYMCNKDNGSCDCKSTYWGKNCENTCSKGCISSACFNETGKCMSGCDVGYIGDLCDICDTGFTKIYGTCTNCTDKCEECSEKVVCTKCKEKYGGIACQTSCPDDCRSCESEQLCTECIHGYFGENCSSICPPNCLSDKKCSTNCTDSICNRLTGECDRGCKENYWGRHCENACTRNCKEVTGQSKCDESNGHCLAGCIEGYFSEQCDKNCSIDCFNTSCDTKGRCSFGCTGEYEDDLCLQAKLQMTEGNGRRAAIIAGSVSGVLILIIIIGIAVAVVFLKRRERTYEDSNEENTTVVYCNINNRGHLSHPETREIETNQSHTAQTSNKEKPPVAQKQSVTKSISNVYEKITRRAESREYSTLLQAAFLDAGSHTASPVVAENFQTIYEQPIIREDIVEYSRLELDTRHSPRGYSNDNEEKQQHQDSAFDTGSAVTKSRNTTTITPTKL